jgi:hypothetical protein
MRRRLKLNRNVLNNATFATATVNAIHQNTQRLQELQNQMQDSTVNNFIFAHAPVYNKGTTYTRDQITNLLITLVSSFAGVKRVAKESNVTAFKLHCNQWACNAQCPGNKILVFLLMMIAANLAGIPHCVIHTVDGCEEFQHAQHAYELFCREGELTMDLVLQSITGLKLERS